MDESTIDAFNIWPLRLLGPLSTATSIDSVRGTSDLTETVKSLRLDGKPNLSPQIVHPLTNVSTSKNTSYTCEYIPDKHISIGLSLDERKQLFVCTKNILFQYIDEICRHKEGLAFGFPSGPFFADAFISKLENSRLRPPIRHCTANKCCVD